MSSLCGGIVLLAVLLTWSVASWAATKVALHATQEEVEIYNQRRLSGPYLDDWNRIIARANTFRTTPDGTWAGNQLNSAWNGACAHTGTCSPNAHPSRIQAINIRDAGFVFLVTGDTTYRDPVRTKLLEQIAITGTNFANTTKWPTSYEHTSEDYEIGLWLRELTYAYSYVRSSLTTQQRTDIDAWFTNAGTYWNTVVHNTVKERWPNRLTQEFGSYTGAGSQGSSLGLTHFGGHDAYTFHRGWDNKTSQFNAAVASIAVVVNNSTLKAAAKKFFKEWIAYATFPDGTVFDQHRWNGAHAQSGWLYAMSVIGTNITTADHLARDGDTELYTFSTSVGIFDSAGGPKNLLGVLTRIANLTLNNAQAYASNTSTTNSSLLIDPVGTGSYAYDVALAQANLFYKSTLLTSSYTRTMPTNPTNGGYDPWGGDWGNLPGARFMFGLLEGVSEPFDTGGGGGGPTCPPSAVCVSSSSDDAEENTATAAVSTIGSLLEFANVVGGTPNNVVAIRYLNIPIPQGATCDSATIALTPITGTTGSGTPSVTIRDESGFATTTFVPGSNTITGRTLSGTTPVAWNSIGTWTSGTVNANSTTPNLCTLLQPKINDLSWSELNNEVAFVFTYSAGTGYRAADSKDVGALSPLTVAYTPAGSGTTTLTQTNYRFGLVDVGYNTRYLKTANAPVAVAPGTCTRLHVQVESEGTGLGAQTYKPQWAVDDTGGDGPWVDLTTDATENLYLGFDQRFPNATATTTTLTLAGDTFVPGSFMTGPGINFPSITLADDRRTEWVLSLCVKDGVTLGTTFDVCIAQQDNTLVTCTMKPRLTVGASLAFSQ